jgi:hypothetical protein
MAEPHDLLKARRESAALLGLGDVERLSPADTLRCDLISTLRLAIDGEQATVLDGGAADLAKLITATENLIRLLPGHELPEPKPADGGPSDPRTIMFENYMAMRRRGEIADPMSTHEGRIAEVERLRARVAELEAALAGRAPGESTVPPLPENVVSLRNDNPRPPAAPPKPAPPAPAQRGLICDDVDDRWRQFCTDVDGVPLSARGKYWGPV